MDFATNIGKLDLANLVGKVMEKIVEFKIYFTFRKLYLKVKKQDFWPWDTNGLSHGHWNEGEESRLS